MLKKRKTCFCQKPIEYDIKCDKCGGANTTWSEYEGHIWCFDCEIDTVGTKGLFDCPIPIGLCEELGYSFDKIRLADGKIIKCEIIK